MSFSDFALRGFGNALVPIIPPDAVVSSYSKSPEQITKGRGKIPGRKVSDGWVGFHDWQLIRATPADHDLWTSWQAGVGLQASGFPAFDIDVSDAELAGNIADVIVSILGTAPVRTGRAPRRLMPYRATEPMTKRRLVFSDENVLEFLAEGQQYLVEGTHPKTGQPYTWDCFPIAEELSPVLPAQVDQILETLAMLFGGQIVGQGRNDVSAGAGSHAAPSIDAVRAVMAAIPNDLVYDTWISVGVALASCTDRSDEGLELWTDWSLAHPDTTAEACEAKWDTFRPPYRIGWDHLTQKAQGRAAVAEFEFAPVEPEKPISVFAPEPVDELTKRFVWVNSFKKLFDLETREMLDALQFSVLNSHVGDPTSRTSSAWAKILRNDKLERADSVTYLPGGPQIVLDRGQRKLNTWLPSALSPQLAEDDDVRIWLDHLAYMYPDAYQRGILLDWLAFLLQSPGDKPSFQLLMGSKKEGIGKDVFLLPVLSALGQHNTRIVTATQICSNWTDWYEGVRLIVVEEMEHFGRRETANSLKPYWTTPPTMVPIAKKFQPVYEVPNLGAMLFFTNNENALPLPLGDRRCFVMWSDVEPLPQRHYQALVDWYAGGGDALVAGWLYARDISAHRSRKVAPSTDAKEMMQLNSLTPMEAWVHEGIRDGVDEFAADLVELGALLRVARARYDWKQGTPERMASVLRKMDARSLGRVRFLDTLSSTDSDRGRLYSVRRHEMYAGLPPAKLAELYVKQASAADTEFSKTA